MKTFCWLLSILGLAWVASSPLPVRAADDAGRTAQPALVPVFSLDRPFSEAPSGDDLLLGAAGGESFQQLIARLEKARDDEQVRAVIFLGGSVSLGNGQLQEVRQLLDELKQAGKEVVVHAESLNMRSYALYSGASRISVVPTGDLWLTGVFGGSVHLRGLLDMLAVDPDFLTCGEYKSAAEMFTRHAPSPEAEANINWLLDDVFDSYVEMIASGRGVPEEQVRQWIDQGLFGAREALTAGIIDEVEVRPGVASQLEDKLGATLKLDRRYGKKQGLKVDFSNPFGVFKFYADLLGASRPRRSTKDAVAIVYVEGPILAGKPDPQSFPLATTGIAYSDPIRKALDKAADDERVKAVVLRVNSPGGSATGSEIILQATRRVKQKKPLVVSMGDVAGSGGYYVACAADTIYADPATITASIGVVGGKLATNGMWEKIGVRTSEFRRGQNAGILSSGHRFSPGERETLRRWMDSIYDVFQGHVLASRQDRLTKDLGEIAGGRVFTGRQALELGLVDKLGGLREAIEHVAAEAGLEAGQYELRVLPRPRNFLEILMEDMTGGGEEDGQLLSLAAGQQLLQGSPVLGAALRTARDRHGPQAQALRQALTVLQLLGREQVSLHLPAIHID
jgi:protease-4